MKSTATTVAAYLASLPADRRERAISRSYWNDSPTLSESGTRYIEDVAVWL
jgi:hypothetical protein